MYRTRGGSTNAMRAADDACNLCCDDLGAVAAGNVLRRYDTTSSDAVAITVNYMCKEAQLAITVQVDELLFALCAVLLRQI
jgi:hypothetical protein